MAKPWNHSQSTTARGYGWQWQKLRKEILARDKYLCQPCKRKGRLTVATEVDHIKEKASGGSDDPSNLQSICNPCHKRKTSGNTKPQRHHSWPPLV